MPAVAKKATFDPRANTETWEVTGDFTVWVWKRDVRNPGQMEKVRVGGRGGGSRRLRISTDERRYNEEQIVEENSSLNPFKNGLLRLVNSGDAASSDLEDVDPTYHWGDEQYAAFFDVRDPDIFREEATAITSELILRRLYMKGEKAATLDQLGILKELIEERYKAGGTQTTVREILEEEAKLGRTISGF
jgi:hypothetical protein